MAGLNKLQLQVFGRKTKYDFNTGLVLCHKYNGNANDASAGGNNGTPINSPSYVTGKVGNAIDLNGLNQYVTVPHNANLNFTNGAIDLPFSFITGVYFDSTSGVQMMLSKRNSGTTVYEWNFIANFTNSNVRLAIFGDGDINKRIYAEFNSSLLVAGWNHIVGRYNANGLAAGVSLRLNGVDVTTNGSIGTYTKLGNFSNTLDIGQSQDSTFRLNGKIDELYIYRNRHLTDNECEAAYEIFSSGASLI